jgi:hypothetical protein
MTAGWQVLHKMLEVQKWSLSSHRALGPLEYVLMTSTVVRYYIATNCAMFCKLPGAIEV